MNVKQIGIKEYIHKTYNNPRSEIFLAYLKSYFKNPLPYEEFFLVYREDLIGEYVWLPYYSIRNEKKKIYEGREAYVIDIDHGLLECLVTGVHRKTSTSVKIDLPEEVTCLTPALFFEFQKEYYSRYRKKGKLTDNQYKKIIRKKNLVKRCFNDFIKLTSEMGTMVD